MNRLNVLTNAIHRNAFQAIVQLRQRHGAWLAPENAIAEELADRPPRQPLGSGQKPSLGHPGHKPPLGQPGSKMLFGRRGPHPLCSRSGFGLNEVIGIAAGIIIAVVIVIPGLQVFAANVLAQLTSWWNGMAADIFHS